MENNTQVAWTDQEIREARDELWYQGILHWKLDSCQKQLYDFYHTNLSKEIVVNASRRLGKSYFLLTVALELCIQKPGAIIKYIQPTRDMIKTNLNPDFELMLQDCPLEMRPVWHAQGNVWEFPNGSRINVAGTDGKNYNKLRGGNADLCIVDEAGFCSDLEHIITSILMPLTTLTGGRILLSSTTPTEPEHKFNEKMEQAEVEGRLIRKTIMDAVKDQANDIKPRITKEIVADILKAYREGVNSDSFRTEFMCERIYNSIDSVLPEFTDEVQADTIMEWPKPLFMDRYVSMDIGFIDLTFVIFSYWDFDNQVLVIEDEIVQHGHGNTTHTLANEIKLKEKELWMNRMTREQEVPLKRVSDNNLQVINDMVYEEKLFFMPTEKHNKLEYLSTLKNMISNRQVIIHPRCKNLISHMKSATWDKQKKDFKRSPDNGHYDGVAALLYLSRNIDKNRNPYPSGHRYSKLGPRHEVWVRDNSFETEDNEKKYKQFEKMFTKTKSTFGKKVK